MKAKQGVLFLEARKGLLFLRFEAHVLTFLLARYFKPSTNCKNSKPCGNK
jgi:hypothetical protein